VRALLDLAGPMGKDRIDLPSASSLPNLFGLGEVWIKLQGNSGDFVTICPKSLRRRFSEGHSITFSELADREQIFHVGDSRGGSGRAPGFDPFSP
jgi:hypothetical protein